MARSCRDRVLVVNHNPLFRETLAQWSRVAGHDVVTSNRGEHAFLILRDWQHSAGWLYTRDNLPILIDGWILADECHDTRLTRPAVISAPEARSLYQGDIVVTRPSPAAALEIICKMTKQIQIWTPVAEISSGPERHAV
jgi:CheY-like chemotaxis protein